MSTGLMHTHTHTSTCTQNRHNRWTGWRDELGRGGKEGQRQRDCAMGLKQAQSGTLALQ